MPHHSMSVAQRGSELQNSDRLHLMSNLRHVGRNAL